MSATEEKLAKRLQHTFAEIAEPPAEFREEWTVAVRKADRLDQVCRFAKETLGFDYLVDISSVDHYGRDPRFELVYELYSYHQGASLRLTARIAEERAEAPSVIEVWRGADWHEREIYDMMGIRFRGHPDLRRILMWEGYPYYPLRKDFPLAGKDSEAPEVAVSRAAPLEGGPFVTPADQTDSERREPRARQ